MNIHPICNTCGTQFPAEEQLPELCPICNDDRQFVPEEGQSWTNHDELKEKHTVKIIQFSDSLYSLTVTPTFAIGQRAFLLLSPNGNILWDCIPLLDKPTIDFIKSKGGLKAIAFSHPHFYSNVNDWAKVFDCPVYIHQNDSKFVFNRGPHIELWNGGSHQLWDDISLANIGGHFPGSSILYSPSLSPGGTIFCGDTFYLAPSKRFISVMYSYPNRIMLGRKDFIALYEKCLDLSFDTLHGASFEGQSLFGNAYDVFMASMKRYMGLYDIE